MAMFQDAIDAINRGEGVVAREILNSLVEADPSLVEAWVLLARLAPGHDTAEQRRCLENIVAIDHSNAEARDALLRLQPADGAVAPLPPATPSPAHLSSSPAQSRQQAPPLETERASASQRSARLVATAGLDKTGTPIWIQNFPNERVLIARLPLLLRHIVDAGIAFGKDTARLERLRASAEGGTDETRRNLMVAVLRSGAELATALDVKESCGQSFWIVNALYEAGKIVRQREHTTTPKLMEQLLKVGADAAVQLLPPLMPVDEARESLIRVVTTALSTQYSGRGYAAVRPDVGVAEELVVDTIATHFDRRLAEIVENDQPSINAYVSTNMPKLYRMRLSPKWLDRRDAWEEAIKAAGYEDTLRSLKNLGMLVRIDQIGIILPDTRDQVRLAADSGDYASIRKLLEPSEKELKNFLYKETQTALVFREPPPPRLKAHLRDPWKRAMLMLEGGRVRDALNMVGTIWEGDNTNYDVRDWAAYLHAQDGNKLQAERFLALIRDSRKAEQNFATNWNLAVIHAQRHDEAKAYELLLPLVKTNPTDERLIKVLLGLARTLNDHEGFLRLIPQSLTLRYHPIAFNVAAEMKDPRAANFLAEMISGWETQWELPHLHARFDDDEELMAVLAKGIFAGQLGLVTAWLRARVVEMSTWIPNYLVLARVLENEHRDIDGAFQALADACRARRPDDPRRDASYRDLLEFCRRNKREDLEQKSYEIARRGKASEDILKSFRITQVMPAQRQPSEPPKPEPEIRIQTPEGPNFTWISAKLARIRDVTSFSKEQSALDEFSAELSKHYVDTTVQIVPWLKDLSKIINQFAQAAGSEADADYRDRLVLYNRATTIERDLTRHLQGGALPPDLVEVMTPFYEALKRVVSDLSRAAGVGPKVESTILNPFIAPDVPRTTVVVQLRNVTDGLRTITDVVVELRAERNLAVVTPRQRSIRKLEASQTEEINFTIALDQGIRSESEVTLDVYVRASAEGFLNIDLPIAQTRIPVKTLGMAINRDEIPKLFIDSSPLDETSPLFQGRDSLLQQIRNSLFGGIQREKLFLDGIRRVGKSSIVNFVPLNVPDDVVAVPLRMERFGLQSPLDAASVLWKIGKAIEAAYVSRGVTPPDAPTEPSIDDCAAFITSVKAFTGKTPFLMFDEFQRMLLRIKETGSNAEVILDILRAGLEDQTVYGLFTGSIRFDRLSTIVPHRIFGNIRRLRVSFLKADDVAAVLRAGFSPWVTMSDGAVKRICDLTAGYPYVVQKFGSFLVDLLNEEKRCIASAEDVDRVANADVLSDNSIFLRNWWPDYFGLAEERAIELFFHHFPEATSVPIDDFLARTERREVDNLRVALQNLQSCEVLDSTDAGQLRFTAVIVRQWLRSHYHVGERRLRIPPMREEQQPRASHSVAAVESRPAGQVGVYIDHENFVRSLARIRISKHGESEPLVRWFDRSLNQVLGEVEKRFGRIDQKVAVAFWDRQDEMRLQASYTKRDFAVRTPERTGKGNEADFKLADEIRRSMAQAKREGASLRDAVVITGDADFTNVISGLKNDGVNVHVWAAGASASQTLVNLVGRDNVVMLDDICAP